MRPIEEIREELRKLGADTVGMLDAIDELERLRAEVHEWRTARTHGVCHEELRAMRARAVDAEDERDELKARLATIRELTEGCGLRLA